MKTCTLCNIDYPETTEYFYKKRNSLESWCKKCRSADSKQRNLKNRDIRLKKQREYRLNNREILRIKSKEYYLLNIDSRKAAQKKWHLNNLESLRKRSNKRRALIKNNGHESYTEQDIHDTYGSNCYLCDMPIDFKLPRKHRLGANIEHFIAITNGGPDKLENVRWSHKACNLTKGAA